MAFRWAHMCNGAIQCTLTTLMLVASANNHNEITRNKHCPAI